MSLPDLLANFLFSSGFFRFLGMSLLIPSAEGLIGIGTRIALAAALAGLGIERALLPPVQIGAWHYLSECLLGIMLGAPLLIVYHGLRMWGDIFESLRGHQMGLILDPLSGGEEQPLAILLSHACLYVLLGQALFPLMTQIALNSMQQLQPGAISILELATHAKQLLFTLRAILTFFFSALLPYACLVLMIEICLAVISKLCSGWSLNQEGYWIRMLAVMTLLYYQVPSLLTSCIGLLQPGLSF